MGLNTCISIQSILDNWQIVLPSGLFVVSELMGVLPDSRAKGISHLLLLMAQSVKQANTPPPPPPPAPPTPPVAP